MIEFEKSFFRRAPSGMNPLFSVFAAAFFAFLVLFVWRASRRVPRTDLSWAARAGLVLSGSIVGFLGLPLLGAVRL